MAKFYARLVNQNKFKYQTVFPARFDKQDENIQITDEIEPTRNLNDRKKLTETDINKIGNKPPLQHQYREQEANDSGLRFNKVNSMTNYFYKLVEKKASNYVKITLKSSANLNNEKDDKFCLI